MRLLAKINLGYVLVISMGLGVSGYVVRDLLRQNAQNEVLGNARMIMEKALAVRKYTSTQIAPLLTEQMKTEFLPQSVPSYSATEVIGNLLNSHPEFGYKEATLNPTNPRDRAGGWEVDVVNQFRASGDLKETSGYRDTPSGPSLYIARPLRIVDPACLECHSAVDAAPKSMVARYGTANGFGWNLNEVVGAQIVSVPLKVPLAIAERSFKTFMFALTGVFVVVGLTLNLLLWRFFIRPILQLSALADRVSNGDLDAPEFRTGARDEIDALAQSFSRMRASVTQAMRLLDA